MNSDSSIDATPLVRFRRELHRSPELSGFEEETAGRVARFLREHGAGEIIEGLGGTGLAAVHRGGSPGPTVLARAELDALPIAERSGAPYRSAAEGISHACGHDGHAAILAGLSERLSARPIERGRAVLLFQPAEETGEGAARVLADPRFAPLRPDRVFALHNLPGFPLGSVIVREGVFASASVGLIAGFRGATSHAAEPERGRSPAAAAADAIHAVGALPQNRTAMFEAAKATVIHARVGERAFGTTPGDAEVMATLRAGSPEAMGAMTRAAEEILLGIARAHGLDAAVKWIEEFPVTVNDADSARLVADAAGDLGFQLIRPEHPFPWSEDFGRFTEAAPGALFGIGAGENAPALHNPDYDFPDPLVGRGVLLFEEVIRRALR
ncbi:MAG: amidohydrolase [Candidatus Eisenbacteria bacterium]|nr:amidohydrolase [Candidatus Eisenbacteria bacterium]